MHLESKDERPFVLTFIGEIYQNTFYFNTFAPINYTETNILTAKERKEKSAENTKKKMMTENEISNKIIGLAIEVHKVLGPGLLESAYKECLFYKIIQSGMFAEKEKPIPLIFGNYSAA